MFGKSHIRCFLACTLPLASAAGADARKSDPMMRPGDIPMVAIGLPFEPEAPEPVGLAHPLFHDVTIGEIERPPPTVKSSALNWVAAAKRSSINAAMLETFRQMNLLAPSPAAARKRLVVSWNIGTRNATTVTIHYRLIRVDSGEVLFDRDIVTSSRGAGADAGMHDNGILRAAIATNFASAADCLDRAAFGTAPADCALTPLFSVSVNRISR